MASKPSDLWIVTNLTQGRAAIILACLHAAPIKTHEAAAKDQHDTFIELSRKFERKWPDLYQILVLADAFPHWRAFIVDSMTDEERRAAAMAALSKATGGE